MRELRTPLNTFSEFLRTRRQPANRLGGNPEDGEEEDDYSASSRTRILLRSDRTGEAAECSGAVKECAATSGNSLAPLSSVVSNLPSSPLNQPSNRTGSRSPVGSEPLAFVAHHQCILVAAAVSPAMALALARRWPLRASDNGPTYANPRVCQPTRVCARVSPLRQLKRGYLREAGTPLLPS